MPNHSTSPLSTQSIPGVNDFAPLYQGIVTRHDCSRHDTSHPQTKELVWAMFDGRCYYCGVQTNPFSTFTIDHRHPRSKGGDNCLMNLVPCCRRCNCSKGARQVATEWVPHNMWFMSIEARYYHYRHEDICNLCFCWEHIEVPEDWQV